MCQDTPKPTVQELPDTLTWTQISDACKGGRKLMVVDGEVPASSSSASLDVYQLTSYQGLGSSARDPISPRCVCRRPQCTTDLSEPVAVQVYDVAGWVQKHPGGKVLLTYVGEDATDSVRAFHRDEEQMRKYLSPLHVATLKEENSVQVLASRPDCWKVHYTTSDAAYIRASTRCSLPETQRLRKTSVICARSLKMRGSSRRSPGFTSRCWRMSSHWS